ncbi:MAG: ABC transporter permease [Pyrinomonadaceae bacterium]|nr:ABC transporter permease [Pyrinomonadaceae bacterium]
MKFWDLVRIANRNLLRNKLRTFLTVMAIFVGSLTLTMTNAIGDGVRDYIENQVKNTEGQKVLFVRKKFESKAEQEPDFDKPVEYKEANAASSNENSQPRINFQQRMSLDEIQNLVKDLPQVQNFTPSFPVSIEYISVDDAKKYRISASVRPSGVTQKTEVGRMINSSGEMILPLSLAQTLNADIKQSIGKYATIAYRIKNVPQLKTVSVRIVGVSTKGFETNSVTYLDATTSRQIYDDQNNQSPNYNKFNNFSLELKSGDAAAIEKTKRTLEEKGFTSETFADQKKQIYDAIGVFQLGLNFFAFIALLAASFGIINTLVIAVLERTKEIGLQKALGMNRVKVFFLFALEAVLIGFWGAVSGIVVGMIIGFSANFYFSSMYAKSFEGYNLFVFTIPSILFIISLVSTISFFAGVLPAFRASRLNPIEALRYE